MYKIYDKWPKIAKECYYSNLSESEKGEVVLKVLRKIMKFSNSKDEKLA